MIPQSDADLLQSYLAGELSADESWEVTERLKTDQEFARALIVLSHEEAILREWARNHAESERVEQAARAMPIRHAHTSSRSVISRVVLAAASLLVAMVGLYYGFRHVDPLGPADGTSDKDVSQPIANLEDVHGEVFVENGNVSTPVKKGQELFLGQKLSTRGEDGFAVVSFKDASRVELGADTTISLSRDQARTQQITLQEGSIDAEVGQRMIVTTPHAYFVSTASKFSVLAQANETRIEPEEGLVDLTTADGKNLQIKAGSFVMATKDGQSLQQGAPIFTAYRHLLGGDGSPILSLAFAPNSQTLATGGSKGCVQLWDVASGRPVGQPLEVGVGNRWIRSLAYSPNGHFLACLAGMSGDKFVRLLASPEGKECSILICQFPVHFLAYAPDGKFLATAGGSREVFEIKLWNVASGKVVSDFVAPSDVRALAFSPNNRTLATGHRDGTVRLWDAHAGKVIRSLKGHDLEVTTVAFAPDGLSVASGSRDGTVVLWNTASGDKIAFDDPVTGRKVQALLAHPRGVTSVAFAPNGPRTLATTGHDSTVKLWELATGREKAVFKGHMFTTTAVAFSPDGRCLASCSKDRAVRLWDLPELP